MCWHFFVKKINKKKIGFSPPKIGLMTLLTKKTLVKKKRKKKKAQPNITIALTGQSSCDDRHNQHLPSTLKNCVHNIAGNAHHVCNSQCACPAEELR